MKKLKIVAICFTAALCFTVLSCQEIFTNSLGAFLYDGSEPTIDSSLDIDELILSAQNSASDIVVLKAIFKALGKKGIDSFSTQQKVEMLKIAATSSGSDNSFMSTLSDFLDENTTDDFASIDEAGRNSLLNGFIKDVDTELTTNADFNSLIQDADVLASSSSEVLLFVSITLISKGCEPYLTQADPVNAYITQAAIADTPECAIQDLVDALIIKAEENANSSGPFGGLIVELIDLFKF